MTHYEAQITKEDEKYIFHFPGLDLGSHSMEQAHQVARQWIEEHSDKIQEGSSFFVRMNDELQLIQ